MVRFQLLSRTRQITEFSCGACALHAVLSYWGKDVEETELMRLMGTSSDVGTFPERMVRGVRALGLQAEARQDLTLDEVKRFTDEGHPMIALGQLWRSERYSPERPEDDWDCGHYIVVLGVDKDYVYFQDPYLGMGKAFVPREMFERHWHQVMGGDHANQPRLMHLGVFVRGETPAETAAPATERPVDLEKLGSLNLLTMQFRGELLPFDLMDELKGLFKSGDVRPAAFIIVRKGAEGEISAMEGGSVEGAEDALEINAVLAAITSVSIGGPRLARRRVERAIEAAESGDFGLSAGEIRQLAAKLEPGHSAVILLLENTWERRFREIVREHGGEVVGQRLLGPGALAKLAEQVGVG